MNQPVCATSYGNTGFGDCYFEPDKIAGAIQVPADFEIAESDLADLRGFLEDKTGAPIGTRIFPYGNFISNTDNTEDATINTTDYGNKVKIKDGFYDWLFRYQKGGVMYHNQVQRNGGTGKYFIYYDSKNAILGYRSEGKLKGVPAELFDAVPWKLANGSDTSVYAMHIITNPFYLNNGNLGYIQPDFNVADIHGLQELLIKFVSLAGSAAKVKITSLISGIDMYSAYSTALAQTGAWKAVDQAGNSITISNVTLDSVNHAWNVFMTTGFAAADKVYLSTQDADVLAGLSIPIVGFEGHDPVTIEGPAS
jgi:hypothetical protein